MVIPMTPQGVYFAIVIVMAISFGLIIFGGAMAEIVDAMKGWF